MNIDFKPSAESDKSERYRRFLQHYAALIEGERDEISVMANTAAALKEAFGFFWVGFYLVNPNRNSHSGRSKEALPATVSGKDVVSAVRHGRRHAL